MKHGDKARLFFSLRHYLGRWIAGSSRLDGVVRFEDESADFSLRNEETLPRARAHSTREL